MIWGSALSCWTSALPVELMTPERSLHASAGAADDHLLALAAGAGAGAEGDSSAASCEESRKRGVTLIASGDLGTGIDRGAEAAVAPAFAPVGAVALMGAAWLCGVNSPSVMKTAAPSTGSLRARVFDIRKGCICGGLRGRCGHVLGNTGG